MAIHAGPQRGVDHRFGCRLRFRYSVAEISDESQSLSVRSFLITLSKLVIYALPCPFSDSNAGVQSNEASRTSVRGDRGIFVRYGLAAGRYIDRVEDRSNRRKQTGSPEMDRAIHRKKRIQTQGPLDSLDTSRIECMCVGMGLC